MIGVLTYLPVLTGLALMLVLEFEPRARRFELSTLVLIELAVGAVSVGSLVGILSGAVARSWSYPCAYMASVQSILPMFLAFLGSLGVVWVHGKQERGG